MTTTRTRSVLRFSDILAAITVVARPRPGLGVITGRTRLKWLTNTSGGGLELLMQTVGTQLGMIVADDAESCMDDFGIRPRSRVDDLVLFIREKLLFDAVLASVCEQLELDQDCDDESGLADIGLAGASAICDRLNGLEVAQIEIELEPSALRKAGLDDGEKTLGQLVEYIVSVIYVDDAPEPETGKEDAESESDRADAAAIVGAVNEAVTLVADTDVEITEETSLEALGVADNESLIDIIELSLVGLGFIVELDNPTFDDVKLDTVADVYRYVTVKYVEYSSVV